jgi:hypothetical protein
LPCFRQGNGVTLGGQELQMGDVKVGVAPKEGFAAAQEAGYAVAVSTEVTPELRDEGLARELVRRIQEMRKERRLRDRRPHRAAVRRRRGARTRAGGLGGVRVAGDAGDVGKRGQR